jgi:hypothetical protein
VSIYADYEPDQQRVLLRAIGAAAVLVSTASPGPMADTVSEGFAAAEYVLGSLEANIGNTLVTSVILAIRDRIAAEEPFPDYAQVATAPDAVDQARAALTAVAALLDARATPEEAAGYKDWLVRVAQASAQGALEDKGFLGRGGVRVNDAERAAIAEVARLLGRDT